MLLEQNGTAEAVPLQDKMPDFLLEIGCEEIPARMIATAEAELTGRVHELCVRGRLIQPGEDNHNRSAKDSGAAFSTPRRISVVLHGVLQKQPDVQEQLQGPATKIAFKDGRATPAAEAFAKKAGVAITKLEKISTPKGEYVVAHTVRKGEAASKVLAELLGKEISSLYWPKSMYWRAGAPERFVRPIRWMVAMLDGEVIPLEFAGVKAGNVSRGHRLFSNGVRIANPSAYKKELEKARVIADPREREQRIRKALDAETRKISGARWREDASLLETVVNLTEWPSVILGSFDKGYLALPEEVLVTVMRDHQKYFAVEDAHRKLLPHFLAVLNTEGDPEGLIRHGNERVLRARFNDAQFFWQTDQKTPLKQRIELLKNVTFQKDLGSYYDKTVRVEKLAGKLAEDLSDTDVTVDLEALENAAWMCKTDLTTELVKEFTELQGMVGGLYARAQGLGEPVAQAIYDHYKPESMDDAVPRTLEGAVLSIADKADSIAGMFALGLQPTGSKDPFALRRQANGIVRIIAEHKLRIDTRQLMLLGRDGYHEHPKFKSTAAEYEGAVAAFMRERLEFYLREARGIAYDEANAVLAAGAGDVTDAVDRALALHKVRASEASENLEAVCVSFKRIKNILRQAGDKCLTVGLQPDPAVLLEPSEKSLLQAAEKAAAECTSAKAKQDYGAAIRHAASIRPVLDKFFDDVMVMVDDETLRANRLALLRKLLNDFSTIADFSEIVTEGKK